MERAKPPTVAGLLPVLAAGQVLLVQRRGLVSRLIRWVTSSAWSHVALIGESAGAVIVLESTVKRGAAGVKIETILEDESVTALLIRDRLDLATPDREAIVRSAWLETGQVYDQGVNVDILWRRLTTMRGWLRRSRAVNCAEMVSKAWAHAWGPLLEADTDPTPEALAATAVLYDRWRWPAPAGARKATPDDAIA